MMEVGAILEIIKLPVEVLMVFLALHINNKLSKLNARIGVVESRLKIEYPAALLSLLLVCGVCFVLSGCLQFDARGAVDGAAAGGAAGLAAGGPVGGIIGAIVAAILGGVAVKQRRQRQRRDRIIAHYRSAHGDIPVETLARIRDARG